MVSATADLGAQRATLVGASADAAMILSKKSISSETDDLSPSPETRRMGRERGSKGFMSLRRSSKTSSTKELKAAVAAAKEELMCPKSNGDLSSELEQVESAKSIGANMSGMCVQATVLEAKGLPTWPGHTKPRTYVTAKCGEGEKAKTSPIGESPHYGSGKHDHPVWNQMLMLPPVASGADEVVFKVFVTTSPTGMAVDYQVGKVRVPVSVLPRLEAQPPECEVKKIGNSTNALLITATEDGQAEEDSLRQINSAGRQPVKVWCKLSRPSRNVRMQTKGSKGGWLCLVLALVPAPVRAEEEESSGDEPADEDEGDPQGTSPIGAQEQLSIPIVDEVFPCSVTMLRRIIYSKESPFTAKLNSKRGLTEYQATDWAVPPADGAAGGESQLAQRKTEYMMPPSSIVKATKAYETQRFTLHEAGGYVLDIETSTPDVPYGGCFTVKVRHVLTRIEAKKCRLQVSAQVVFSKSTMMRGMIESGTQKGVSQTYSDYVEVLRSCIVRQPKQKGPPPFSAFLRPPVVKPSPGKGLKAF
eukprot:comp23695_c0_seq2/m.40698 comp23695_c0_seq2/g.40698  ORF comp23695_c0_seq2/g.40698 comp23695_c0_seq2/m.40698 type:complete len:531 (-) comp23695_c0_seq2:35-1627(-)